MGHKPKIKAGISGRVGLIIFIRPGRSICEKQSKKLIMKKLHLLALAISTVLCVPLAAQASDGTITFKGLLNTSTCTVTAPATGSFLVTLPTLPASTLSANGKTAGDTGFSITVAGCAAGTSSFTPFFESGATTDAASGRLNLTVASTATNVQLQLLNFDSTPINVANAAASQGVIPTAFISGATTATGRYIVRYYATGAAGAGSVNSSLTYSMTYI